MSVDMDIVNYEGLSTKAMSSSSYTSFGDGGRLDTVDRTTRRG